MTQTANPNSQQQFPECKHCGGLIASLKDMSESGITEEADEPWCLCVNPKPVKR